MFNFTRKTAFGLSLLLTLLVFGCKKTTTADYSMVEEGINPYVYAFTSGIISKADPIRVRLANTVISADQIGEELPKGILSFSPAIKGIASWEDEQTILFQPTEWLDSGKDYVGSINLEKLITNIPKENKQFQFTFHTKDQYITVSFYGLEAPDPNNLRKQALTGSLFTGDLTKNEAVEKLLTINQNGRTLTADWSHESGTLHKFTIRDIDRNEAESSVKVSWNGKAIGVTSNSSKNYTIPSLGDFKVMTAEAIQDQEQYISLRFSDPLQRNQNVNGLVTISNYSGGLRYIIDGNELRVYTAQRINGARKVIVSSGIKNSIDIKMATASEWNISFEETTPKVRLAGKGVILPTSNGLIFPFDAIGLKAIDIEIFKIYDNNILQFLQTNELDGDYQMHRVGRLIMQKRIDLGTLNSNAKAFSWNRYALNLDDLMDQDSKAIYQVRIGFRKEYAIYNCGDQNESEDNLVVATNNQEESEEIQSFMYNNYYGRGGYYSDYNWSDRDDPCKPAYYNSSKFISRNVLASNLGIIAKAGKDKSRFFAITDLRTASPVSNAQIELYDFQQQLITSGQTNGQGIFEITPARSPYFAIIRAGDDRGYIRLEDGGSLSLSKFDIAGTITQKGMKGYLYGERGVWRPGDSVYLNFILEDKANKLPSNYPINFEIYDARGQLRSTRTTSENKSGVYPLHFTTSSDDPTGNWIAKVKAGGATFDKVLKIETVKPNRLKINLDFGQEVLSAADEPFNGKIQVNWLHGAPARNLKAVVEVGLKSVNTSFQKFSEFEFDDPARRFNPQPKTIFDRNVDENGSAFFQPNLVNTQQVPGQLRATFKSRAFEKGGDFSTDNFSVTYHPFKSYTGIAIPMGKYGGKSIPMGQPTSLSFAAVNTDGTPIANRKLSVGLYRVQWRWWWDRGYDNIAKYNSSSHSEAKERTTITTGRNGQADWAVKVDNWGRYLVRVCDTESGHCSGDFFYVGSPRYENGLDDQARKAAAMLAFNADKKKYNVGEKVKLTIPTGKVGQALVTVENGTKVIDSYWVNSKDGENEFTFEATPDMAPTVYAHVSLVQPHGQVENDLPIRLYGVIPINIEDPSTKLAPTLKMPDELQPEQEITVEVSEKDGKAMAYTLAVVDEGLLGLTRFKTPQPWDAFYSREALGVKTWDVYDKVMGAYGGELESILSIGGDGEIVQEDAANKANRFKPVVMHLGPFELKKGRSAKHRIKLPNYVGAVRTMVVAAKDGAYGNAEKTTPVKKPLMVLATLPRVLGPGETLKLPVTVFAMDQKMKNVTVKVREANNLVSFIGESTKRITFNQVGDQLIEFDIQVNDRTGVAKFTIEANGHGEKAGQEIEVQVRNPNPYVTNAQEFVIQSGEQWEPSIEAVGMYGTNEGVLEVSNIPPINIGERMRYLLRYPYGCLEQTLSSGFPQLYVGRIMELTDEQTNQATTNIQATIDRLKLFQLSNGGFSYWPGNSRASGWSSTYAGHFLLEAKALGHSVPTVMINRWIGFQQQMARTWSVSNRPSEYGYYRRESNQLAQAYRLYTLALAQKPDLGAMNRLREVDLSVAAKWRLAAAYAMAGKPEIAQDMVRQLNMEVKSYKELGGTFGSVLRDKAMILETLTLIKDNQRAAQVVKYISDALNNRRWYSTQAVSYSLLAIGKHVGESGVRKEFKFVYKLGNERAVNAGSNTPIFQIDIPVDERNGQKLMIKNTDSRTLYAKLILTGQPVAGQETDEQNDLQMEVVYRSMNGQPIDPTTIQQGTDFVAEIKVTHPGVRPIIYEELALTQIFPSGWEIINSRLDGFQSFRNGNTPEYRDFKDDRVNTFFDINQKKRNIYRVQLNAAYQGRFYLPATSCEAMYDNEIYARKAGQWVDVVKPGAI